MPKDTHYEKYIVDKNEVILWGGSLPYLEVLKSNVENNYVRFVREYISENAVIIDVGANIGYMSIVASILQPKSRIYATEPGQENYTFLERNIETNDRKNVSAHKFAIGRENSSGSFMEDHAWGHLTEFENPLSQQITIRTLDSFVVDEGIDRVDFIKIDVEGFEMQVFEGMTQTLKKFNPKILFEFNSFCMIAYGKTNPLEFLEYIDKNFSEKFIFNRGEKDSGEFLLNTVKQNFPIHYLHENIVRHASGDDFLVFNL